MQTEDRGVGRRPGVYARGARVAPARGISLRPGAAPYQTASRPGRVPDGLRRGGQRRSGVHENRSGVLQVGILISVEDKQQLVNGRAFENFVFGPRFWRTCV